MSDLITVKTNNSMYDYLFHRLKAQFKAREGKYLDAEPVRLARWYGDQR